MKKILILASLMILTSCATHVKDSKTTHHHHNGKMNCTTCPTHVKARYDVNESCIAKADLHQAEVKEYELYHDGLFYYFTSEQKMKEFKKQHNKQ